MARITTTDCEHIVPNRFELVVLAAARARELLRGDEPGVLADGDRPPVIALREIAAQKLDLIELRQRLLRRWLDGAEKDGKPETSVRNRMGRRAMYHHEGSQGGLIPKFASSRTVVPRTENATKSMVVSATARNLRSLLTPPKGKEET